MNHDQKLQDILDIVQFMKEHMVSEETLDEKLAIVKSDLMNHMDGFIGLHQKLDPELTVLRSK